MIQLKYKLVITCCFQLSVVEAWVDENMAVMKHSVGWLQGQGAGGLAALYFSEWDRRYSEYYWEVPDEAGLEASKAEMSHQDLRQKSVCYLQKKQSFVILTRNQKNSAIHLLCSCYLIVGCFGFALAIVMDECPDVL